MTHSRAVRWGALTAILFHAAFLSPPAARAAELTAASLSRLAEIIKAVEEQNAGWIAGPTEPLGRDPKKLCGYLPELLPGEDAEAQSEPPAVSETLPSFWDWRNKDGHDWTTGVRDQMACGSCYVFAACAAAEHGMKVQSGPDGWQASPDFSEQFLVSCAGFNCDGGWMSDVLEYLKSLGAPDDPCFPYTADDTTPCDNRCPDFSERRIKIHNWKRLDFWGLPSLDAIKKAIMTYGSVTVGFDCYSDFMSYSGGVYEYTTGNLEGGHAVTLVGWDDSQGCWIGKNSWGTNWGETKDFQPFTWGAGNGGWFRMKYTTCGVGRAACYSIGTLPNLPRPDLTGAQPAGWAAPLVPRNSAGATASNCTYTSSLDGLSQSTYINFAGANAGNQKTLPFECRTFVDGVEIHTASFGEMQAGEVFRSLNAGPFSVMGGRHTVKVILDSEDTVVESDESIEDYPYSNAICGQFVWSPVEIGRNTFVPRPAPPANDRCPGNLGYFNCDGYSFAAGSVGGFGHWSAVAVLPNSTANYSVRLYDRGSYGGIFTGFDDSYVAISQEAAEPCDFVLVNTRKAPPGTYYAGVVNTGAAAYQYRLEHDTSVPIGVGPGPGWDEVRSVAAGEVLDLYEVYLTPGNYSFNLKHLGGTASLGMALFHCNLPSGALHNDVIRARSDTPGDRSFSYNITVAGYYALAVFKCRHSDVVRDASYRLVVGQEGIYVRSPNGGEKLGLGETHAISWDALGQAGDGVNIYISRNGGASWTLLTAVVGGSSQFNWTVSGAVSNHCKIKVQSVTNPSHSDVSDAVFTIVSRSIHIVSPVGGETLQLNFPFPVAWSSDNVDGNVRVLLSQDSGATWTPLSNDWPNSGNMFWYVVSPASTRCRIKVVSLLYPQCFGQSASDFTISGPSITVTSPQDGDSWKHGQTREITWSSFQLAGNVNIDISRNGGNTWSTLFANTANDGSQMWTVTSPASANCRIRVASASSSYIHGISGAFEISVPYITVTSPSPGLGLIIPNGLVVQWNAYPMQGDVKIELSRDNGSTWTTLVDRTPNDGHYVWTPSTGPNSEQCLIRVSDADDPSVFDVTDGAFKLTGKWIGVLSPNGGERIFAGEPYPLSWVSELVYSDVRAELSRDGGATWTLISGQLPAGGTYLWTPSPPLSDQCRVRITSIEYPSVRDTSDADFAIDGREINVIAPNAGENVCPGATKEIRWTIKDVTGTVAIHLSRDNGQSWTQITAETPAEENYFWEADYPVSSECLIRVSSNLYPIEAFSGVFSIGEAGVGVTYPVGGESLVVGRPCDITWTRCGTAGDVDIELSRDGGVTWSTIIAGTPNDGVERWTASGPDSVHCLVRVTPVGQPNLADVSDAEFEVITRTITVVSPNGGEKWSVGRPASIEWNTLNAPGPVKIELTTNRGISWTTLEWGWNQPSPYVWTVQGAGSDGCRVRITSNNYQGVSDQSDAAFEIVGQFLDITSPDGGEELTVGAVADITWMSAGLPGSLKIELTRDRGATWEELFASVPNVGSKSWTVTGPDSTQCRMRLTYGPDSRIKDVSETSFSIVSRSITVTGPSRHSVWGIGDQKTITWSSANVEGNVSIAISRDGGSTYSTIASGVPNTGNYDWTVTAPASVDCYLRVTSDSYPSVFGRNTYVFSVSPMVSVPCQITLQDWIPSPAGKQVSVAVCQPKSRTPLEIRTLTLDQNGSGQFQTPYSGIRDLRFKSSHWLEATAVNVNVTGGMPIVPVSLPNGDCTEDGKVDADDLDILKQHWSVYPVTFTNADLNGDGRCDAFDLLVVRKNWSAGGSNPYGSGTLSMWLGDETGNPLQVVETLAGEPFDVHVWAATTGSTWFINAALGFDTASAEGASAVPTEHYVELASADPALDIAWGGAAGSYPVEIQKALCGFYSHAGGVRPYGASLARASVPGDVAAFNLSNVGRVSLRHRMKPGMSATISLWNDGSDSAGALHTMAFGLNPQYCPASSVTVLSYIADTIAEAKASPDLDRVHVKSVPVSAVFDEFFYVESPDRSIGIRVVMPGHTVSAGSVVNVSGEMYTHERTGERCILSDSVQVLGSAVVEPLGMTCKSLGGGDWLYNAVTGAGQIGVSGASGVNNIGLLVRLFGKFRKIDQYSFAIDDGSGFEVLCAAPDGVFLDPAWQNVVVTGVSSCVKIGDELRRLVLARAGDGVVPNF